MTKTGTGMCLVCCRTLILSHHCFFFSYQTFLNQCFVCEPLPDTDATISLPSALEDFFLPGRRNKTRIQFNFYGTQKLFQVLKCSLVTICLLVLLFSLFIRLFSLLPLSIVRQCRLYDAYSCDILKGKFKMSFLERVKWEYQHHSYVCQMNMKPHQGGDCLV